MSTRDDLRELIHDYMPGADGAPDSLTITDAILARFDVYPKATPATQAPEPAVGQRWRNKASGRIVEITEVSWFHDGYQKDVYWKAINGRGPASGMVWRPSWPRRYTYVGEADRPALASSVDGIGGEG